LGTIARLVLDVILQAGGNVYGQVSPAGAVDVSLSAAEGFALIEVGDNGPSPLLAGELVTEGLAVSLDDRRWMDMGFIVSLQLARRYGGDLRFVRRAPRGRAVQIHLPL
jgi:C4-dicarboxylate-specific signal transduction histidine kinase